MKDWKGNEVQVGQAVYVIDVGTMFDCGTIQFCYLNDDGTIGNIGEPIKVNESFLWEISVEYLIEENGNSVTTSHEHPYQIKVPINLADFMIAKTPWQIVCIKGISDDREEYYLDKFKVT